MNDFKLPELPSDDELGITEEDLEKYGSDDEPELSEAERRALLGDDQPRREQPRDPGPPPAGGGAPPSGEAPPKEPPEDQAPPAPEEPAGPRSRWRGPAMLAALVALAWLGSSYRTLPSPRPANAPDTAFSSARAMAHMVEISRRPHPPGSPAHEQVRGYLVERLRDMGFDPKVQTTVSMRGRGSTVRAVTVRNILVRIPGTASTGTVVLTAHYDGREISRAAGDDGSGVVSILEAVRALQAGPDPLNDLLLLITDAEELGLMGAKAFVDQHPEMAGVKVVLSLEMRGAGGPSIMFETGAENGWVVDALKRSGARPYANSMSYEVYKHLPNDTDFTPFREAGRQGLNFAAIGRASIYHQNYDSPENFSEATLQHHGDNLLRVARVLAFTPLSEVTAPDQAFFTVPVFGLVTYDLGLTLPLAAAVLILALVVLLPVRRTSRRWSGIAVGLVLGLLTVAGTAGAGYGLMQWLPRFHPEFGSLHGSAFHHEGWYVSGLVAVAVLLATTLFGAARKRFTAAELTWGALLLPLVAMVYVSFRFPAGAMNLQIPLAFAYVATGFLVIPARGRWASLLWVLMLALSVPVLAMMVPVVEFVWIGLSFRAAVVIGAVAAILVLFLLPALDRLREPNAWWAPLTAMALGALLVAVGIQAAAPDPQRPAPATLTYVLDHGTGEALWITDNSQDAVDEPAHAWAAASAGSAFTEERALERYGFGSREPRVTSAPVEQVRKPEIWALADTVVEGTRHLRLGVRSTVGAELLQFRFPEDGGTRLVALDGRTLPIDDRPALVEHWGAPDPVVILDLEMSAGAVPEMDVVEHLFRPQELVGEEPFDRPPELAPDITWLSDRAVLRTPAASLDVIPGPPPFPVEPEGDPAPATLAPAVMEPDAPDAMAPDTMTPDTVAPDTVAPDTVAGPGPAEEPADTVPAAVGDTVPAAARDTIPAAASVTPPGGAA